MSALRLLFVFVIIFLLFTLQACTNSSEQKQSPVFKQVPEIQEIKPQKPVKIKLKRNTKGDYSWDLSGDNADEVIKVDKRLRKGLEKGGET